METTAVPTICDDCGKPIKDASHYIKDGHNYCMACVLSRSSERISAEEQELIRSLAGAVMKPLPEVHAGKSEPKAEPKEDQRAILGEACRVLALDIIVGILEMTEELFPTDREDQATTELPGVSEVREHIDLVIACTHAIAQLEGIAARTGVK
jgi:hypothetical protein